MLLWSLTQQWKASWKNTSSSALVLFLLHSLSKNLSFSIWEMGHLFHSITVRRQGVECNHV